MSLAKVGQAMDPLHQIEAVTRTVLNRMQEGRPARATILTQTLPTNQAELWDAVTNLERISKWFAPVTGELRYNGRFQIEGNAAGSITYYNAPNAYDTTWEYGDGISWLEVRVESTETDRSTLTISHIAHPNAHWEQYGPAAVGIGWDLSLHELHEYLINNTSIPTERTVWGTSPEAADIARGENPDDATRRGKKHYWILYRYQRD